MGYGNRIVSSTVEKGPSTEPITVEEFKSYGNVPFTEDDAMIASILTAARQYVETKCNISIGKQVRKVQATLDGTLRFSLPYQPLIELDTVRWTNCDCLQYEDIDDTKYALMGDQFATFRGYEGGFYEITYVAGYHPVPAELKNIVKAVALSMYEQRGDASWSLPSWIKEQLKQYSKKTWV